MGKTYKIREVAEKIGISPSIIRHYEEKGLVNPIKDPENGYRLFSEEDLYNIWDVTFFRSFGMGLNDIDTLFHGCDFDDRIAIITRHRQKMEKLLQEVEQNILLCDFTERYAVCAKEIELAPYIVIDQRFRLFPAEDFYNRLAPTFPVCTYGMIFDGDHVENYTVVFEEDMEFLDENVRECSVSSLVIECALAVTVRTEIFEDREEPLRLGLAKAAEAGFDVVPPYYAVFLLQQRDGMGAQEYYYRVLLSLPNNN